MGVLTELNKGAFGGCSSLTSITIPYVPTHIGDIFNGFNGYSNRNEIPLSLKEIIITGGTSIGGSAFDSCSGLTSITIPDSVTSIGDYAFAYCSGLTSIIIPDSVTSIGREVFAHCSGLTSIIIPFVPTYIGDIFDGYDTRYNYNKIPSSLKEIIITGVTSIGGSAFSGCSGLTSVTIPNSVTSIGGSAFSGCSGLTSITIPDSVTSIGEYAFYECSGLTSVIIPNSVTSIGHYAFNGCSGLTKMYYKGTEIEWNKVEIESNNGELTNATKYYYSETQPTTSGNYWHYDVDGKTPVEW